MRDLHNNINAARGISPAAIITGNATTTGQTLDVSEFGSIEFLFAAGAIADGTFTVTLYEGDESDMSDESAVASTDLLGSAPTFVAADANAVKRVGYKGNKRYVRAKAVQTSATTGGYLSCVVVQGHPKLAPVS